MSDLETLKAWCHWKRKETGVSDDDLEFVKAIDDLLAENANLKAVADAAREVVKTCEWYADVHRGPENEVHHALKVEIPATLIAALGDALDEETHHG